MASILESKLMLKIKKRLSMMTYNDDEMMTMIIKMVSQSLRDLFYVG